MENYKSVKIEINHNLQAVFTKHPDGTYKEQICSGENYNNIKIKNNISYTEVMEDIKYYSALAIECID